MFVQFVILVVKHHASIPQQISHVIESINFIGGYETSIAVTKCDKDLIMNYLIRLSNSNNNVIIIIGDTTTFVTNKVAHEAIKEVMDKNPSDKLNELMSDLEENLKHSFESAICGVRKQTLMINMCGCCISATICLTANRDKILQIICSIAEDKPISSNINDNNDNNSENASSSHCSPRKEKKRISKTIKMYKTGQQNIIMNSVKYAVDLIGNVIGDRAQEIYEEVVDTKDAHGRILADNILSCINVPSCRTSAKHGYAVLASDGWGRRRVLAANVTTAEIWLERGTCIRVRSGAPIPYGATAVVTLDNTLIIGSDNDNDNHNHNEYFNSDDNEYEIYVLIDPAKNDNIRNIACEIFDGQFVLERYSRIGSAEIGILTLCGIDKVLVVPVSSVGLLSIGDELADPENFLGSKCIYDSNRITLTTLLKENGFDSMDFGISAYQLNAITQKMQNALEKVDVLVTMGRANDYDMLKPILKGYFKANIHFGRVNMKPGKSTTFATCTVNDKQKYLLCMSANPTTVPIVAHLLLLPLLNRLNCKYFADPIVLNSRLTWKHDLHPRPKFAWTTLQWEATQMHLMSSCSKNKNNSKILRYPRANALLMLPPRTLQAPEALPSAAFVQATLFASQIPPMDA